MPEIQRILVTGASGGRRNTGHAARTIVEPPRRTQAFEVPARITRKRAKRPGRANATAVDEERS